MRQHHVYDTTYALSKGIQIRKLCEPILPDAPKDSVRYRGRYITNFISRNRWHATKAEAIADAEAQRKRKIASLSRQLEKLQAMTFDAPELSKEPQQ